jgi:D-alanyl-D-alanine carboxypeptidase
MPVTRRRRRRRRARPLVLFAPVLLVVLGLALWWLPLEGRPGGPRPAEERSAQAPAAVVTPSPERAASPTVRAEPPPERLQPPRGGSVPPATSLVGMRPAAHRFRPPIRARSAILVEAGSGRVLWARMPHRRAPMASTTKIMTALLALERLQMNDLVTIHPSVPRAHPFREGLRTGERVPVWKLLYGTMLFSGNDAALALALATSGTRPAFLALMNERARELGLRNTHFATPSGVVDRDNYSTAWDMAVLTRYAMEDARFRRIVKTRRKQVGWAAPTHSKIYVNKNRLLGTYRGADGVKTGWTTAAGSCLVASATRNDVRLIAVVLGSPDAARESRRLLDYGFRTTG